nr:uncharacterized protein LOC109184736 [Ipomoea trifida]
MKDVCNRLELELVEDNGRYLMPKASYSLNRTNQLAVFEWLQTLKLPDGFSSNLAICVDSTSSKLIGMKSHDCHIFMQFLLPVFFMFLPSRHWKPLTEFEPCLANREEAATQIQQTQPELGDSNVWYEAAGGLKKGGYVFGFGSDTPHYFPEVVSQRNSKSGQSSSHAACDKKLDELKDQVAWLVAEVAALRGSNQQRFQSTDRADSHESSGVGLDDLGLNDGTQSPTQAQ